MLKEIYGFLLKVTSKPDERGEYSGGYLQDRVRQAALFLCRRSKGRLLEVGCGEGIFLAQLEKQDSGCEIFGIDNDKGRLRKAAFRVKKINLSSQEAFALSFEDGYFDTVICINVFFNLESIGMVKQALAEMARVCGRPGRIIFDFRNSLNPLLMIKYKLARYYDPTVKNLPLRTYSPQEIADVLNSLDLRIINKKYIGPLAGRYAACIIIEAQKE